MRIFAGIGNRRLAGCNRRLAVLYLRWRWRTPLRHLHVPPDRCAQEREPECHLKRALIGIGRIAAKKRGVKFGRKPKLTPEQVVLALRLVDEGQSVPQVAVAFGVHETTIYRCLSAAEAVA